jgi:hypothetical protein
MCGSSDNSGQGAEGRGETPGEALLWIERERYRA